MHFIAYLMAAAIAGLVIRWVYLFERARRELKLERQRREERERLRNIIRLPFLYTLQNHLAVSEVYEALAQAQRATYKPRGKYVRSQQADETTASYVPNYDFGASRDYKSADNDWSGGGGMSGGGGASASWDSSSSSSSTPDFGNVESGSSSTEN